MLEANSPSVNELIAPIVHPPPFRQNPLKPQTPSDRYQPQHRSPRERGEFDPARSFHMRARTRRVASLMAALGITLTGSTGCQTWFGGMTLPSGRYLQHYPQYFAPDPHHPLPRNWPARKTPKAQRRAGGFGFAPPPVAPVPPVPAPAPGPGWHSPDSKRPIETPRPGSHSLETTESPRTRLRAFSCPSSPGLRSP